jgi:hypothetical protein
MNRAEEKAMFLREAETMYEELRSWRDKHGEASFDEIAEQVTVRRRGLMGKLLEQLATQHGDGRYALAVCPECEQEMESSGQRSREVLHSEGEVKIERAYHHCGKCGRGFFPPRPTAGSDGAQLVAENHRPSCAERTGDSLLPTSRRTV